jgi:predicted nucleotidyltransferase
VELIANCDRFAKLKHSSALPLIFTLHSWLAIVIILHIFICIMHILDDCTSRLLFGKTRRGVLTLLLENPGQDYYMGEIARSLGLVPGAIQRELAQLVEAEIITRRKRGVQVFFQANTECPIHLELRNIVTKTSGLILAIQTALVPLNDHLSLAVVFGSFASGQQTPGSDVDLLIVGDVEYADVIAALTPVEDRSGREINPTVYSPEEFNSKRTKHNPFIQTIVSGPRIELIGHLDDSRRLGSGRVAKAPRLKPR